MKDTFLKILLISFNDHLSSWSQQTVLKFINIYNFIHYHNQGFFKKTCQLYKLLKRNQKIQMYNRELQFYYRY